MVRREGREEGFGTSIERTKAATSVGEHVNLPFYARGGKAEYTFIKPMRDVVFPLQDQLVHDSVFIVVEGQRTGDEGVEDDAE